MQHKNGAINIQYRALCVSALESRRYQVGDLKQDRQGWTAL